MFIGCLLFLFLCILTLVVAGYLGYGGTLRTDA